VYHSIQFIADSQRQGSMMLLGWWRRWCTYSKA